MPWAIWDWRRQSTGWRNEVFLIVDFFLSIDHYFLFVVGLLAMDI